MKTGDLIKLNTECLLTTIGKKYSFYFAKKDTILLVTYAGPFLTKVISTNSGLFLLNTKTFNQFKVIG